MDVRGVPVVGVLLEEQLILVLPLGQDKGTVVGHALGRRAISVAELLEEVSPARCGVARADEAQEVRRRVLERDDDGLVVGRRDAELLGWLGAAAHVGAIEDVVVDLARAGRDEHALEGVNEVAADHRLAVRPFRVAQVERVGLAVVGNLPGLGGARRDLGALRAHQRIEDRDLHGLVGGGQQDPRIEIVERCPGPAPTPAGRTSPWLPARRPCSSSCSTRRRGEEAGDRLPAVHHEVHLMLLLHPRLPVPLLAGFFVRPVTKAA